METSLIIVISLIVLAVIAIMGYFLYRYTRPVHNMNLGQSYTGTDEGSSSMAGHLINKMKRSRSSGRPAMRK